MGESWVASAVARTLACVCCYLVIVSFLLVYCCATVLVIDMKSSCEVSLMVNVAYFSISVSVDSLYCCCSYAATTLVSIVMTAPLSFYLALPLTVT